MSVRLRVDAARWRTHVAEALAAAPATIPVVKGNGYGFGRTLLAEQAQQHGADLLAVGTYPELRSVAEVFAGSLLVLTPWRPFLSAPLDDRRVVHTVSRLSDLRLLAAHSGPIRVVVEVQTEMRRHGIPVEDLPATADLLDRVTFEGWSLHLPLAGETTAMASLLTAEAEHVRPAPVLLSHVPPERVWEVSPRARLRAGTRPWLGDPGAMEVQAQVLDAHPLARGDRFGYRQRRARSAGTLLVVAGGTSHGIALSAPSPSVGLRQRGVALARGGLDAVGLARSPFVVDGRHAWFAEPPHMQCSMVWLPHASRPPKVGDWLRAQVRYTTVLVDEVQLL